MNKPALPFSSLYLFFALTFAIGWVFWISAALTQQDVMRFPVIVLHTLGGLSPSTAGIIMIYCLKDRERQRDFWRRTVDFSRIGLSRTLWILVIFPVIVLASIAIATLFGADPHNFSQLNNLIAQPLLLAAVLVMGLITGPISEELGWRGFALDILQSRWGVLLSSLILGLVWWGWHLPLFFIVGTPQYRMGIGTIEFWFFLVNILPLSLIMTWFYNQTRRSILSAILLHYGFNVTANLLFPLSLQASIIFPVLLTLTAAGLRIFEKRKQAVATLG
jgi:uncharacterized protein